MRKLRLGRLWPRYVNRKIGKLHLIVTTVSYHAELTREFSIGYGDRWILVSWGNDNAYGDNKKRGRR